LAGLRGKSIGGERILPEILLGIRRMWRAARAPGRAPLHRKTPVLGERTACPPGPRNEACLMVFACKALASGPGMAWNSIAFTPTWRKVRVGKGNITCH